MSAAMHAQRFLDACPADVRGELQSIRSLNNGVVQLVWDSRRFTVGRVEICFGSEGRYGAHIVRCGRYVEPSHYGHIDRLLSGYTPEQNLTVSTKTATASHAGQGGNLLGMGEATHG